MEIKDTLDSPRLKKLPPTQLFFGSKKSICFNQTRKVWHPGNSGHNTGLCLKITHVHLCTENVVQTQEKKWAQRGL